MTQRDGPLERAEWPRELTARVTSPDDPPRVHGYDVEGDLARHYRVSDTVYLSLAGHLPNDMESRGFEIAMQFLAPAPISEAPAHAASLTRLCRSRTSGVVATAAVALAEQARWIVEQHQDLIAALEAGQQLPEAFRGEDAEGRAAVRRLRDLLPAELAGGALSERPTRWAALVALLHGLGLRRPWQMESAITCARLPVVIAEAMAVTPGDFRSYPMDLPAYRYEEGPE